ncbi:hypothetical protein ACFCX4_27240 [Kitasatospora sp. NPDC056327]|uniref:hypothetical protein n=1 Tax=Kitasatospora sp. NPDC056327 TaxID=3345785 RepID=UPI0035DBF523
MAGGSGANGAGANRRSGCRRCRRPGRGQPGDGREPRGHRGGQAARWSADGTPLPLAPTALTGVATGINDQGTVIGYTSDAPPARAQFYAPLWNADSTPGTLPAWHPSHPYATPSAISDSGLVVGELLLRGLAGYGRPFLMRRRP